MTLFIGYLAKAAQRSENRPVLACFSERGVHTACLQGFGIAPMTQWDFARKIASGDIVVFHIEDATPPSLPIWELWLSLKYHP